MDLEKNLVNVTMRTAEAFYNIFMHLYNKNILEYGQIARNGTESIIADTDGHSNINLTKYIITCCLELAQSLIIVQKG